MRKLNLHRVGAALALLTLAACARSPRVTPLPLFPFTLDIDRAEIVSDGVVHRYLHASTERWAIHVLDVDLARCNSVLALKGTDTAAGRIRTSDILARAASEHAIVAGVNADFFSLANGTPVNLLIVNGKQLTPPATRPVFAMDSAGVPHIGFFASGMGKILPFHPREAVGGRPIVVKDSALTLDVDTIGGGAFASARHPRTAVGIAEHGRRLIFVVVDGRQAPYSDGMTLRELGWLMLALGAHDALNLDGGGSTTMLYADSTRDGALRVANWPSDREGERAVGNALGIAAECDGATPRAVRQSVAPR